MPSETPKLRWGIIATGMISSWFVQDLALSRNDAKARHIVQAIGSSSLEKGKDFVKKYIPNTSPTVYGSYEEVYADPDVDIVYIGTPHAFHKRNCLDAIKAGKHVLCEKPFTIIAKDTREVIAAAKENGVFIMEAMWTRFFPLMQSLQKMLHEEKVIGDIHRTFCDFGLDMDIASLQPDSRLKNPALGAGTLLDIGIYSLTFGLVTLDSGLGQTALKPSIVAEQTLSDGIDIASTIVIHYPSTGRQGILTSTTLAKTPESFCRIEGSEGYIIVEGPGASCPSSFTVYSKTNGCSKGGVTGSFSDRPKVRKHQFENPGRGFFWEADAVALDIAAGRTESTVMPWAETVRVMDIMDEVRRQGGARFPQDDQ